MFYLGPICLLFLLFLLPWETDLKKPLLPFMSKNVLPMFTSRRHHSYGVMFYI